MHVVYVNIGGKGSPSELYDNFAYSLDVTIGLSEQNEKWNIIVL